MANTHVRRRVVGFVKTKKRRRPAMPDRRKSSGDETIIGGPAKPMTPLMTSSPAMQARTPWWKSALFPVAVLVAMLLVFWLASSVVRRSTPSEMPRTPPVVRDSPARQYGQYGAAMPGAKAQPTEESFLASHRGTGQRGDSVAAPGVDPPLAARAKGHCVVASGSGRTAEAILDQLGNCLVGPR